MSTNPTNPRAADPDFQPGKRRQQGFALLIMLIIVVVGSLYAVTSQLEIASRKFARDEVTAKALVLAKEATIGYAAGYALPIPGCNPAVDANCNNRPGDLPCPDNHALTDINTGTPTTPCSSNAIGRLPDKTLGIFGLTDSSGERLWYAVSTNFKNSTQTGILNSSAIGTITIRDSGGNILFNGNGVVAIIVAPGTPLTRSGAASMQDRSVAGQTTPANYLDTNGSEDNAAFADSSTDGFVMGPVLDASRNVLVNDQIITITRDEIMAAIGQRVAREALTCLNQFPVAGRAFPWPAPLVTSVAAATTGRTGSQFGRFPLNQENVSQQAQVEAAISAAQTARTALAAVAGTAGEAAALQSLAAQLGYLQNTVFAAYLAVIPVRDQASNTKNASGNAATNTAASLLLTEIRNSGFDAFLDELKPYYDDVAAKLATFTANSTSANAATLRTSLSTLRTLIRNTTAAYTAIAPLHFPYTQNTTLSPSTGSISSTYTAVNTARTAAGALPLNAANIISTTTTALTTTDALMKSIGGYVLNTTASTIQEKAANVLFATETFAALATKNDAAAANIEAALQTLKNTLTALAPLPPAFGALPATIDTPRTTALAATNTAITSIQLARTDLSNAANATAAVNNATAAFNQTAALAQVMQGQRVNFAASSITNGTSTGQADVLNAYIVSLQTTYTNDVANAALSASNILYRSGRFLVSANAATTSAGNTMRIAASTAINSLQTAIAALPADPQLATKRNQSITDALALKTAALSLAMAILNNGDNVGLETLSYWKGVLASDLNNALLKGNTAALAVRAEATKVYNQAQTFLNNSFFNASSTYTLASTAAASASAPSPSVATVLTQADAAIASAANLIANNLNAATGEAPAAIIWPKHAACDWIGAPTTSSGSSWQTNEWQKWVFVQLNDTSVAGNLTVNGSGNYPLIVIAPGPLLGALTGDSTDPAHYMENNNATGPQTKQYVTGGISATFNDRIAY